MKTINFCINNECKYWRTHEDIYREFKAENLELAKHFYSFNNYIASA